MRANSTVTVAVLALLYLLGGAASVRAQDASLEGLPVASVRVVNQTGEEIPEKLLPLALKPGAPFHMDEERKSLRELFSSGLFADIHTQVTTAADGLHVNFVVERNYYNNVIRIDGLKEPPNEATALAALRLPLGRSFQMSALNDGLARLDQTFREDGLYEAKWKYQLAAHADTREMNVTVEVIPGPRARISSVGINNQTPYSAKAMIERSGLKRGTPVTSERIDRGMERLRNYLVAAGYLGARVLARRGNYDPNTKTLPITLDVTAGPRVRVEVVGAKISSKKLRKLLPIYAEGAVDSDLLEEGRRNIRDALQGEGYFDSTVNYAVRQNAETHQEIIQFTIYRGIKHKLVGVEIDGNRYFDTDLLRSRLEIQPKSLFSRGHFTQQMVRDDADSIHALYLANGFLQSQVRPEVDDDYHGKKGDVFVAFHITEGPQTRVAELQLVGNQALTTKQLLTVIGSTPGQPYSEATVTSDRDNILAYYFDQGYPDARFEVKATEVAPHRMNLVYHITEGSRVDVSRVLLAGYRYTKPGLIRRQVMVKPGGPLREGDVIGTQQKLYNLGIFDRVQVAPQNPAGDYPEKAVVVAVEEGKRYTVSYGFGFEAQRLASNTNATTTTLNASPLGILELSKINVGGRAHTASLKLRASTLEYQGLLSYTAPNFLTYPSLNLIFSGFADRARYVNTFTATRYEGSLQIVQTPSPRTSIFYRYFYRHVLVDASTLKISPEQIPLFSQPTEVSGFGVTWARDHRNNPADASQGSFNTLDVSVATRALGSSATFLRFFGQDSTFTPLGRGLVFARSTRFGVEEPFHGSGNTNIPLAERFFAGGGTSLRGFGLNQAGPRDPTTGFPVGGLAMLVFNQELRFPMRLPFVGDRIGGAVFYDAGNVFTSLGAVTLRTAPPAPVFSATSPGACVQNCTNDLNYFSHTLGFGLRYRTPIGPVRLDFGYQLNPARFLVPGTAPNTSTLSQLPHFQFFFNIGSIF